MRVRIENISKTAGRQSILQSLSIEFYTGINFLIGHDGAGKTTLIKILTGTITPDSGKLFIDDTEVQNTDIQLLSLLGYAPSDFKGYRHFTVIKLLKYIAALKDIRLNTDQLQTIMTDMELLPFAHTKIKELSCGIMARLNIAQSILNNPKIVVMDEPMRALDMHEKYVIGSIISRLAQDKIVIIADQYINTFVDHELHFVFIQYGKVMLQGDKADLIAQYENHYLGLEQAELFKHVYMRITAFHKNGDADDLTLQTENRYRLTIGAFVFDKRAYTLTYKTSLIQLTPVEFLLLLKLAENCGEPVSAEALFTSSCDMQFYKGAERVVSVHIARIRKKLNSVDKLCGAMIKNIRNAGYVFTPVPKEET